MTELEARQASPTSTPSARRRSAAGWRAGARRSATPGTSCARAAPPRSARSCWCCCSAPASPRRGSPRYDPIKQNYRERLQPPSEKHLLGTDRMGRDIYSRLLWGGRRLVTIAIVAVAFGLSVGMPYGVLSGYFGGKVDTVGHALRRRALGLSRAPTLSPVRDARPGMEMEGMLHDMVLVFALALPSCRRSRGCRAGSVLVEKQKEYVEASRAVGEGSLGHRAAPDPAQHRLAADRQRHGAAGLRHPDRGGVVVPRAGHAAADARLGLRPRRRARLHGDRIR